MLREPSLRWVTNEWAWEVPMLPCFLDCFFSFTTYCFCVFWAYLDLPFIVDVKDELILVTRDEPVRLLQRGIQEHERLLHEDRAGRLEEHVKRLVW
jgi:hypothetical protein